MGVSQRLKQLIQLVTSGYSAADIGTDHGYVPISLIRDGISRRVIAADVSRGSLEKALYNAVRAGICIEQGTFTVETAENMPEDVRCRLQELYDPEASRFTGSASFRLADGLEAIEPGEAECIILSGMGGILMTKILSARPDVLCEAKELILSPHRDADLVRQFLLDQGYQIVHDEILSDHKKEYPVIKAVNSRMQKQN